MIVEVVGVHLAHPCWPRTQARHIRWLMDYGRRRSGALIVVGDFNLTPFSAKLTKFAFARARLHHMR